MKKIIGFFILTSGLIITGCTEKPAQSEAAETTVKTIIVEKEAPASSTSIVLDKNGVKVEAENIDVKIKKD